MSSTLVSCLVICTLFVLINTDCSECPENFQCCDGVTCYDGGSLRYYSVCGTETGRTGDSCCYTYTALWWFLIILAFGILAAAIAGCIVCCVRRNRLPYTTTTTITPSLMAPAPSYPLYRDAN